MAFLRRAKRKLSAVEQKCGRCLFSADSPGPAPFLLSGSPMRMTRPTLAKRLHFLLSATLAAAVLSCSTESIDTPRVISVGRANAAKGGGTTGPSVSSANPAYGDEGTTVDVHVLGSGFATGAQATWLLNGIADPAHVRTNKTTFVSSTELVANITIAPD